MATLSAMQNSYINNFPKEVPLKAAQGFLTTVAINFIIGNAARVALVGGALAATATMIEAITRPIIRAVFPEHPLIACAISIITTGLIISSLIGLIAPWIGVTYKVSSVLLSLIPWFVLNFDVDGSFYERNVAMAEVF